MLFIAGHNFNKPKNGIMIVEVDGIECCGLQLPCGRLALIDLQDSGLVSQFRWCSSRGENTYYVKHSNRLFLHQLICPVRDTFMVDHRNGNGLDNRRCNLRPATRSQNYMNTGKRAHNASGFKGVSLDKKRGLFVAEIMANKIRYRLGRFDTPEEAARAYDAAAKEHFKEFASLNFPHE